MKKYKTFKETLDEIWLTQRGVFKEAVKEAYTRSKNKEDFDETADEIYSSMFLGIDIMESEDEQEERFEEAVEWLANEKSKRLSK